MDKSRKRLSRMLGRRRNSITQVIALTLCFWIAIAQKLGNCEDGTTVEGWTQITNSWPQEENSFFITTTRGHKNIEVNIPRTDQDLLVTFEYYHHFRAVRPHLMMVSCNKNLVLLGDEGGHNVDNEIVEGWKTDEKVLKKDDCVRRNMLEYNIYLHDNDDIFAWRLLEVKEIPPGSRDVNREPTDGVASGFGSGTQNISKKEDSSKVTREISSKQNEASINDVKDTGIFSGIGNRGEEKRPSAVETPYNSRTGTESKDLKPAIPSEKPAKEIVEIKPSLSSLFESVEPDQQGEKSDQLPEEKPSGELVLVQSAKTEQSKAETEASKSQSSEEVQKEDGKLRSSIRNDKNGNKASDEKKGSIQRLFRKRRALNSTYPLTCRPNLCDSDTFHFTNFLIFSDGIPKSPPDDSGESQVYISTNDSPLVLKLQSDSDLSSKDICLEAKLYMDKGTKLDLVIEDSTQESKSRKLMTIEPQESRTERWEHFRKCVSDFIRKPNPITSRQVELKLKPHQTADSNSRVVIAMDRSSVIGVHQLADLFNYIPDVHHLEFASEFIRYWILDEDGMKPKIEFEEIADQPASSSAPVKSGTYVHISNIDPEQKEFDITSRWMKIEDPEIIENPILVIYRSKIAEWIESIDFEYQGEGDAIDSWKSKKIYENPIFASTQQTIPPPETKSNDEGVGDDKKDDNSNQEKSQPAESVQKQQKEENGADPTDIILKQVNIRGLGYKVFRVRVRHHVSKNLSQTSTGIKQPLDLLIGSLAFADACADESFCSNQGRCRQTGAGTAECLCISGYSGAHCEEKNPLRIRYGFHGQEGKDVCEMIGATATPGISDLRCIWPNDKFYDCRPLFRIENGKVVPLSQNGSGEKSSVQEMEDEINSQSEIIIILIVFICAVLLFSLVLIGTLISRLMKSKKSLKKAETDVHELTRRSLPSTSGSTGRLGPVNRPKTTINLPASYTNRLIE